MVLVFNLLDWILAGLTLVLVTPLANALGSSCQTPLGPGDASPTDPYWLQSLPSLGTSAFNPNPATYPVRRNVKDFGAKGDGVTDDTAAINNAISYGSRCGNGTCESSTLTPALIFFPAGTYMVSSPIIAWYYSQLVGDPKQPPTLLASANFSGIAVIDADVYVAGGNGAEWYINQDNFYREVRNFVIDLRDMPATAQATGLHWQVSQATSLYNIRVEMSRASDTAHQGLFMENGSGGFMGDLIFNGGQYGIHVGNQQFTVRNATFNDAQTAVFQAWNWAWTFQNIRINNCSTGFELTTGKPGGPQATGAETILDAIVSDTPTFVMTTQTSNEELAGSILLDNIKLHNVQTAVKTAQGETVLAGPGAGEGTITKWAQGNVYSGKSDSGHFVQSSLPGTVKPPSLLQDGNIASRGRPQYETYSVDQFVSVKALGAKGDGQTDDTNVLQRVIDEFWGCKIIFFDAGTYVVTNTIHLPADSRVTGEAWPVIMGSGSAFQSQNAPKAVVQVGAPGSVGAMEITDIIFSTRGPAPGAILVEWNVNGHTAGGAGTWDTHIRLGAAKGTNLGSPECVKLIDHGSNCFSAFMGMHLTPGSSGYFEAMWIWNGDHDLDGDHSQISAFSGRGLFSESTGPVWLIGTGMSEHHALYQYNLFNAVDHYLGMTQTESPYYQPTPSPPAPFSINPLFHDPSFPHDMDHAWGLRIGRSANILVYGAGLYSFFRNYSVDCVNPDAINCQNQILDVDSHSSVVIHSLSTVGTVLQLSVDEVGIINQSKNSNGFEETVTSWTP